MKKLLLVLILLLAACAPQGLQAIPTAGLEYYVSPSGSDSNPGTLAQPFASISKCVSVVPSGGVCYVRAGSYSAYTFGKGNVTIQAYAGEMPKILQVKCSSLSNITIRGFEVTGVTSGSGGAIYLNGCHNSTIEGNKVHDNPYPSMPGIYIAGNDNHVLSNDVYNNGFSGIRVSGSQGGALRNEVAFNKVHNNTISGGNSDGIEQADAQVSQTWIHDNEVYLNADDGIDTWTSHDNILQNNVCYQNGGTGDGFGFKLGGNATGGNNRVLFNISHDNLVGGFTSGGGGNYYEGNQAYNNPSDSGFVDSYRASGNSMKSQFINNYAWNNHPDNFHVSGSWIEVYTGNQTTPPSGTITPAPPTNTFTPAPPTLTRTATATRTNTPTRTPTGTASITLTPSQTVTPRPPTQTFTPSATPAIDPRCDVDYLPWLCTYWITTPQ